ncbi:restriction endonuclease [Pseudomonas sp. WN033]|nr:restriction endonuclease [Pseudomonas sp. WN033]
MSFEIDPGFETVACDEYCLRVADGTHDSPKQTTDGKLLVTSKNVKGGRLLLDSAYLISDEDFAEINRRSKVDQWDLLLTMIGTVGEVCIVSQPNPMFAIKNVGLLKCGSELRAKWLYYFLRSSQGQQLIEQRKKGSTQQYISLAEIRNFPVSYPANQRDMRDAVTLLSLLDDRITLLRETNVTLEAIAQALFKSWFVDFDPMRAKAEGRQPEGMDAATAALFPDSFEESELGLVPKGWRVGFLSDVCIIASGKRPPDRSDHLTEVYSIPLYGGAGLMGYTSASLFDEMQIVTGRVGTLGKVHIAYPPFWASDNVLVVSPKLPADFSFALNWIRSIDVQALNRGSTQPLLTQRDLGAQQGLIPSREVLGKFEAIVGKLYERSRSQEQQAQTLTQLRDTLLPRLISGQLRLPEAQKQLQDALA